MASWVFCQLTLAARVPPVASTAATAEATPPVAARNDARDLPPRPHTLLRQGLAMAGVVIDGEIYKLYGARCSGTRLRELAQTLLQARGLHSNAIWPR